MSPEQLLAVRRQLGLSRERMADALRAINPALRVSGSTLQRCEEGRATLHPDVIAAILDLMEDAEETDTAPPKNRPPMAPKPRPLTADRRSRYGRALSERALALTREAVAIRTVAPDRADDLITEARRLRRIAWTYDEGVGRYRGK